jgi:hypothetical protein
MSKLAARRASQSEKEKRGKKRKKVKRTFGRTPGISWPAF